MSTHQIIVGNVGTILTTTVHNQAQGAFDDWVLTSKANSGRAAGELVAWLRDGEPYREYQPPRRPDDTLPDHEMTASQLAVKYSPNGDGEHPRFQRIDWQIAVGAGETIDSYWGWVRLRVTTEHENAPENQVNVHNFTVAVTAPVELSREEVLELLTLLSSAGMSNLQEIAEDRGAGEEEERERAAKALTMNVEVL